MKDRTADSLLAFTDMQDSDQHPPIEVGYYMPSDENDPESPREFVRGSQRAPRRAYRVVDDFEAELADYCGSKFAVTVDSCTNAITLALHYEDRRDPRLRHQPLLLPKRTYVGVLQAVRNAGFQAKLVDVEWQTATPVYELAPTCVVDSARWFAPDCFNARNGGLVCLSFHSAKQLPLGRGGTILTDDAEAAEWLRAARMDGRPPGAPVEQTLYFGMHCPMPPDTAARGLWILSRWNDADYTPPPLPPETYPDLSLLA